MSYPYLKHKHNQRCTSCGGERQDARQLCQHCRERNKTAKQRRQARKKEQEARDARSVQSLDLPPLTTLALLRAGIRSLGALQARAAVQDSGRRLIDVRGIGVAGLRAIEEALAAAYAPPPEEAP